jgi:hypothetical protein
MVRARRGKIQLEKRLEISLAVQKFWCARERHKREREREGRGREREKEERAGERAREERVLQCGQVGTQALFMATSGYNEMPR